MFDEVLLSFLPVGHTHEDIDQFFSRLAVHLRHHNSTCRGDLTNAIESCYMQPGCRLPHVVHRETAANISQWLEPHLGNPKRFAGVRDDYYCYSIVRRADERAVVRCRRWPGVPDEWRGFDFTQPSTLILQPVDFAEAGPLQPDDMVSGTDARPEVPVAQRSEREGKGRTGDAQVRLDDHWKRLKDSYRNMVKTGKLTQRARHDLLKLIKVMTEDPAPFDWSINFYLEAYFEDHGARPPTPIISIVPVDAIVIKTYCLLWCTAATADPRTTQWYKRWRIAQVVARTRSGFKCHTMERSAAALCTPAKVGEAKWLLLYDGDEPLHEIVTRAQVLMPLKLTVKLRISKQGQFIPAKKSLDQSPLVFFGTMVQHLNCA